MADNRIAHLRRFYALLAQLESNLGGARRLAESSASSGWAQRGVYFFREAGELRTDSGSGPRVVRVGTHALKAGAGTSVWTRLAQHKGQVASGGGNHRGSIFRLIVGAALIRREDYAAQTWALPTPPRALSGIRSWNSRATAADVSVDATTGRITLNRIAVAHDCGLVINADGLKNQIDGNVI